MVNALDEHQVEQGPQATVVAALERLEAAGWTVHAIAARLGASRHTVSRWRTQRQSPDYPELVLSALVGLGKETAPAQGRRGPKPHRPAAG